MDINDIERLQQAQRHLLREFQESMIDRSRITDEERAALLKQYQAELKNVEKAKKEAMHRFDDEIVYYTKLISHIKK